ncbi:hypothetical protein KDA_64130 [Dictyobacter alpinus]|uniref:Glycosyl hydrolases family 39 N-terminal catalytic domain-containing protein n=1 Tax=Dictyobacter alpinus TaxID=2014873 RepID=A0A402BHW3_9CHLR|nr:hypothetical protein [Dictyobacter alpinus]GCE30929.1 hypothetical protein KDA_64130 [Dictyobacter alpinus]
MARFTSFHWMGKRHLAISLVALTMVLLFLVGGLFSGPLHSAHADASITGSVDWGWNANTGNVAHMQYGLNAYNGYDPATQANSTYQNNVAAMRPGIVRWHYAGQMNDSTSDRSGWIINPNTSSYQWDINKINNALRTGLGSSGAFRNGPTRLMDIVNWPAYLDDGHGHLRTDAYDAYASLCAQLVKIINSDGGYGFHYFEIFNELENGSGSAYDHNMAELGRIYNKVAAAMKQVDAGIKVGGPAFARPDLTYNVDDFFSVAAGNMDFVSYHSYALGDSNASNQTVWNAANIGPITDNVRNEFQKYSSNYIDYLHDEYNISWNPPDQKMNTIVGGIFDALAMVSLVNNGASGGMAWNEADGWYGKLDAGYNPRPAAYIYQYMNEDMQGAVVNSSSSDTTKVVIMAVNNSHQHGFVLINRSEADQSIQLSFNNLPSGVNDGTAVTVKQASAAGGSINTTSIGALNSSNGYNLPANTVIVLSFTDNA